MPEVIQSGGFADSWEDDGFSKFDEQIGPDYRIGARNMCFPSKNLKGPPNCIFSQFPL